MTTNDLETYRRHFAKHGPPTAWCEEFGCGDVRPLVDEIDELRAKNEKLLAALETSHQHVSAKPGCNVCEVLGTPEG